MNNKSIIGNLAGWVFGLIVLTVGTINSFWGNDPLFGVFVMLLSLIYFPPVNALMKKQFGFSVHRVLKIILGCFIIWAALGVGELFNKIELIKMDL